jgi:hypothetical protein
MPGARSLEPGAELGFGVWDFGFWICRSEPLRGQHADSHEDPAVPDERLLIASVLEQLRNGKRRQQRAHSVARRNDAGRKAAAIGEPLHHVADHPHVDDSRADAADQTVREIQTGQRCRPRGEHPAQPRQRATDGEERARTEAVHEESLSRCKEGLDDDQNREGDLNLRQRHAERCHQRLRKQRPDILRTRNHDHADETKQQLNPARPLHSTSHEPPATNH